MKIALSVVLFLALANLNTRNANSQEMRPSIDLAQSATVDQKTDMRTVISLLQQQQKELAEQRQLLEIQSRQIATLSAELDKLRTPPEVNTDEEVRETLVSGSQKSTGNIALSETMAETTQTTSTVQENQALEVAKAQSDDPSRDSLKDFVGAWSLPGTNAALAIGGFVKTDVIYNFDALQSKDRFIVGSIPVGIEAASGDEAQSSITANQSRLNVDLREPTDYGLMRAFIEGDFAGGDDDFRLRHAFGQWKRMLAGKTWTTFMDPDASPEEIDFEGLNGRINVRQSQVRFMPRIGSAYELQFALEDPNPELQDGSGISQFPDIVLTARFQPRQRLHVKFAILLRQIRGKNSDGQVKEKFGGGAALSGRFIIPIFDPRDNLLFQLSAGNGIGRYVNDLSSIGSYDGIFDPSNGQLELFDVVAGYTSLQHWWGVGELRSNFTLGIVDVVSPDFLGDDAYKKTLRFSSNLIWSPIPRIDLGAEYLWGRRENVDGDNGNATQLQVAVKYRF
jgi:hypothetical protein